MGRQNSAPGVWQCKRCRWSIGSRSVLIGSHRTEATQEPCIGYRLAVESSHENTGSFTSVVLVGHTGLGTDRAGRVDSGERLETRLPDRGPIGVGSLG